MDIMKMGKNPNYLGSYDLYDVPNSEITVTIDRFADEEVVANGQKSTCTVMYFKEQYKPMIMNVENKKRLAKLFHSKETENFTGKRISIHIEKVKAFGDIHDALRIKQMLPKQMSEPEKIYNCVDCGAQITAAGNMTAAQTAEYTNKKYGRYICAKCAKAECEKMKG